MTDTEQERAEFEAWHEERYGEPAGEFKSNGFYDNHEVQAEWRGWQARAALQSQDREDAERYRYIKGQMETGAVSTQLPLERSVYWIGSHVDCGDVRFIDEAIDHARRIEGDGK